MSCGLHVPRAPLARTRPLTGTCRCWVHVDHAAQRPGSPPLPLRLLHFLPWEPFWPHHASQGWWPPRSPLALVSGAGHLAQYLQAAAVRHPKTGLVSPRTLPVQLCTASLSSLRGFLRGLVLTQKRSLAPHGPGTQHSRLGGARTWVPALPDQCTRGCPGHQMLPAD